MTDNFDFFREYIKEAGIPASKNHINDKFFTIDLIRRGKDCPDLPAANYTFKIYYIDSLDAYDLAVTEIKVLTSVFPFRAYISVNCKSKMKSQIRVLNKIAQSIGMGETKKPWKQFSSACQEIENKNDKRWIVDVDTQVPEDVDQIEHIIKNCSSKYQPDEVVLCKVKTKNGYHIITRPFNTFEFNNYLEINHIEDIPEIKKNHLTLLYEDL